MLKKQLRISGKKILITGGAGFIGSFLCEHLVDHNKLTVFDNLRRNALQYTAIEKHPNLNFVIGDILNLRKLDGIVKGQDIVIHLAAIAGVSSYYKNPLKTLEIDALGTYNILHLSSNHKIKQVILFSTSEVYGPHAQNVTEDSLTIQGPATDSRWSYAVGKLIGDHFAFAYAKIRQLNVTILRPFNIYGPRQIGEGAVQVFMTQALKQQPLTVRGKGTDKRSWCYIEDFIVAVLACINNQKTYNQIFNIANPTTNISSLNLAQTIIKLTHSKSEIVFVEPESARIRYRSANINKAQEILGFTPKTLLGEGLKYTYDWFKNY